MTVPSFFNRSVTNRKLRSWPFGSHYIIFFSIYISLGLDVSFCSKTYVQEQRHCLDVVILKSKDKQFFFGLEWTL